MITVMIEPSVLATVNSDGQIEKGEAEQIGQFIIYRSITQLITYQVIATSKKGAKHTFKVEIVDVIQR